MTLLVLFPQARFEEIQALLLPFLKLCGFREASLQWLPAVGTQNQNLTSSPTAPGLKAWWKGPTLVEAIDNFKYPPFFLYPPPSTPLPTFPVIVDPTLHCRRSTTSRTPSCFGTHPAFLASPAFVFPPLHNAMPRSGWAKVFSLCILMAPELWCLESFGQKLPLVPPPPPPPLHPPPPTPEFSPTSLTYHRSGIALSYELRPILEIILANAFST